MSHPVCRRRKRLTGFTLVELLVVIGIIAVLIAILLPAIRKARLAARNTLCASRLRNLTAACAMYQNEHRVFPEPPNILSMGVIPPFVRLTLLNELSGYLGYPELPETFGLSDLPPVVQCPFAEEFEEAKIRGPSPPLPGGPFVVTGYQYTARLDEPSNATGVLLRPTRAARGRGNNRGVIWSDHLSWYSGSGIPLMPPGSPSFAYFHAVDQLSYNGLGLDDTKPLRGQHRAWSDGSVEWVNGSEIDFSIPPPPPGDPRQGPAYGLSAGGIECIYVWF